jgi:DNA-binding NtrC family response regulator
MLETMTQILLVGTELPLLEGLAQSFAAQGFEPIVAQSLHDARESAALHPPLIVVVSRALAATSSAETLSIPLAPGGAFVLYRAATTALVTLPASVQRAVLADLSLPLERNRLMALVQHVGDRVRVTGRGHVDTPTDEATPTVDPG